MSSSNTDQPPDVLWEHQARIDPSQVQMGHFVARLDIPWKDTPFPMQGLLVNTAEVRSWLIEHCVWVVVDLKRSRNKTPPMTLAAFNIASRPPTQRKDLNHPVHALRRARIQRQTMKAALKGYVALDKQARRLIKSFSAGGPLDALTAQTVVRQLSITLEHNLAAMVWLTRIKQQDNYTAEHCINVAVLSMGLAHALNWHQVDVELAGLAGLLHDLGKMRLNLDILNKVEQLTTAEFEHLKAHSLLGYEMLKADPEVPASVSLAVLEHHERPDGQGYPHGKRDGYTSRLAALVSVVDAYDAITSHRVYDAARSHHEALSILWRQRGKQFDREMVEVFIQFTGWVTPGTVVKLSTGDLAIVIQANMGHRLLPVIRLLLPSPEGYQLGERWDLAEKTAANGKPTIHITEVLPDGAQGVDLRKLSLSICESD